MNRWNKVVIILFFVLLPGIFLYGGDKRISRFELPFKDKDARYFFTWNNTLYLGNHPERTMYKVNSSGKLEYVEDMKGWYIVDAWAFRDRLYYCSRQRMLYKKAGKVVTIPINLSEDLISITAGKDSVYLLDRRKSGYHIIVLGTDFAVKTEFPCPGREPSDIVWYENSLWIYDIKNRSVYRYDPETREVAYTIYTGADNCYSKGILFYRDRLYVHNRESASLDMVVYKETPSALLAFPHSITYEYIIDSKNVHKKESCTARFRIPVPRDSPEQYIHSLVWQTPPGEIKNDLYGQPLAYMETTIEPGKRHVLSYNASVTLWAVHYKIKETPLSSLDSIPGDIKSLYLKDDSYYSMDDKDIRLAADKARKNGSGKEPAGVRELIENIVNYLISSLSYNMDNTWEPAAIIAEKKQASCSEYSFLFSALARLNNVPTRMAGGFIFGEDDDSFHRWTEVWYPGTGWVPVDVTAIDSDDPGSWDFEFLFGKSHTRFVFSLMGGIDGTALGTEYYGYKRYNRGKRERRVYVNTIKMEPLFEEETRTVVLR